MTGGAARRSLLVICPFPQGVAAGQRLKYEQYFDDWQRAGWDIRVSSYMDEALWQVVYQPGHLWPKLLGVARGLWRRWRDLLRIRRFDCVYVFMWVTPFGSTILERLTRKLARALVYDLEDNILAGPVPVMGNAPNRLVRWLKGPGKARYLLRHADAAIVASPFLVEPARAINLRGEVHCITPSLDVARVCPAPAGRSAPPRPVIGWTGTFSSRAYLDLLAGVFRQLAQRVPFTLRVIGNFDYELPGVDLDVVRWSAQSEARDLQSLDIGVYPLVDDAWTRGKAGLKIIQYQAAGLPCVASDVPLSRLQMRDGETGFLAADDAQWVDRLEQLLRDPALRQRMGQAARDSAVALYSHAAIAPAYRTVLDRAVSMGVV